ncbi:hypothetical protein FGIG_02608 [Fasciola gigantica]|uniref:Uncharacterized protein n=1 Tax=Fasciola gigantica TaxID=46835 RepID=A0A504ZAE2_FASGI|nr:hypothetical protein FGIG_02608 [Fasciola gigantica]
MPNNYEVTSNLLVTESPSVPVVLKNQSAILKARQLCAVDLPSHSTSPGSGPNQNVKQLLSKPTRMWEREVVGFRIRNTSFTRRTNAINASADNETQVIFYPRVVGNPYPVYRFYSSVARAYVTASEGNRLVSASVTNPFSTLIEWEWISIPTYSGAYLRHAYSQRYLCFNQNGRPILLKNAYFPRCFLRINAYVKPPISFSKSFPHERNIFGSRISLHQKTKAPDRRESKLLFNVHSKSSRDGSLDKLRNLSFSNENRSRSSSSNNLFGNSEVKHTGVRHFGHEVTRVPWPQLIWISTAARMPQWRIQFCSNGQPFAHLKPKHNRCPLLELPRLSELLVLQLQVSAACISACRSKEYSPSNTHSMPLRQCPKECLRDSVSYFNEKTSRVNFVKLFSVTNLPRKT